MPNCPDPTTQTFQDPPPQQILADFSSILIYSVAPVSATPSVATVITPQVSTSSTTTSYSIASTHSTALPPATASPSSGKSTTGHLSTGAKAGIGVGAAIGAIILVTFFVYFLPIGKNRRKTTTPKSPPETPETNLYPNWKPELHAKSATAKAELEADSATSSEIQARQRFEARTANQVYETAGETRHGAIELPAP